MMAYMTKGVTTRKSGRNTHDLLYSDDFPVQDGTDHKASQKWITMPLNL